MLVPYAAGQSDLGGADCWGLVELWYRHRFDLELGDRCDISPGPDGLSEGYSNAAGNGWFPVDEPRLDDLVVMRHVVRTKGRPQVIEHGHCGIVAHGGLLHTDRATGPLLESLDAPHIARRITAVLRHEVAA